STWEAPKKAIARSTGSVSSSAAIESAASVAASAAAGAAECAEAQRMEPAGPVEETIGLHSAQDLAGDHQPLDLARALADLHQLGVAVHALDRQVAHVADPAMDLDRLVGHPVRRLAREQLGHRGFLLVRPAGVLE